MPITKKEKEEIINGLIEKLQKAKGAVFADFTGLKVQDAEKLRKNAKKQHAELLVAKKTLLGIALKKSGIEEVPIDKFEKGVATLVSYEDEITAAKLAVTFNKENKALGIVSGLMMSKPVGHRLISLEEVKMLASLPGKQELLTKLAWTLKSPITGFVNVLSGNLRGFVNVLNGIKESKSKV